MGIHQYNHLSCDQANYIAVSILEKLGLNAPTQNQIDIIETIVQLAMQKPKKLLSNNKKRLNTKRAKNL